MPNDVPMFEHSGLSIAMGNASAEVQQRSVCDDFLRRGGVCNAVERFILQCAWKKR